MTKAEEKALERFPEKWKSNKNATGSYDKNYQRRKAFFCGYEQAEKDLGWISVKDRLPEENKEENKWVFVCVDMQGVPQCVGMGYYKNGEWCDDENDNGFVVDYWMEVPKLPEK